MSDKPNRSKLLESAEYQKADAHSKIKDMKFYEDLKFLKHFQKDIFKLLKQSDIRYNYESRKLLKLDNQSFMEKYEETKQWLQDKTEEFPYLTEDGEWKKMCHPDKEWAQAKQQVLGDFMQEHNQKVEKISNIKNVFFDFMYQSIS